MADRAECSQDNLVASYIGTENDPFVDFPAGCLLLALRIHATPPTRLSSHLVTSSNDWSDTGKRPLYRDIHGKRKVAWPYETDFSARWHMLADFIKF